MGILEPGRLKQLYGLFVKEGDLVFDMIVLKNERGNEGKDQKD